MSGWGQDADALSIYYPAFEIAELEPGAAGEDYLPEVTTCGTTRAFVTGLRPVPVESPPASDDLLRGVAIGMAISLPLWFALVGLVLFFAER